MVVPDEKLMGTVENTEPSNDETSNTVSSECASAKLESDPEDVVQDITDDQYPHGWSLIILAGASIVSVFLIALDQVSALSN